MPCSKAAKTRNQLKFAGVPQAGQPIPAAIFADFFASCISASRVQHVSALHPKFALRPHHV